MVDVEVGESFLQAGDQSCGLMGLHNDVIDVHLQVATDMLLKAFLHTPLEGSPSVLKAERHGSVAEGAEGMDEECS